MQSRGEPSWGLCPRATGKFEANHSPSGTGVTVASRRAAPYPEGSFWPVSTVRGSAAIRPESEDKPTLRGHRGNGADDPCATWTCLPPTNRWAASRPLFPGTAGGAQSLRAEVGLSEENCQYRDSPSIFHKTLWRRLVDKALRQLAKSNHARDRSPGWYSQPA